MDYEAFFFKPFFSAVRSLYVSSITKTLKIFPFGDTLLRDLAVYQPDQTATHSIDTIISLAKRFPQLGLDDFDSLDQLREEFLDFFLFPMDLPTPSDSLAADGTTKPRSGSFWWKVGQLKRIDGTPTF